MPIHDWSRVRANRFHDFHQSWVMRLRDALNGGVLPDGYFALAEQVTGGPTPDVVAQSTPNSHPTGTSGVALQEKPVVVRHQATSEALTYARKADAIKIYHPDGDLVSMIEIVSPGNKESRHALRSFVRKAEQFLFAGIHLLIIDLFPPSRRDPQGIHKAIWDRIKDEPYELPEGKPFTLAAYTGAGVISAFVNNVGVGDVLPDMPVFLDDQHYVNCPLETTYQDSWAVFPTALKGPLESP